MTRFCGVMIISLICGFGCQPAKSQIDQSKTNTSAALAANGPGVIKIHGTVKKLHEEAVLFCGRSLIHLAEIQVDQVTVTGSGVTRPPTVGQTVSVQFHLGFQEVNEESLHLPGLSSNDTFKASMREKPCFGTPEVYYEIFVYSSL